MSSGLVAPEHVAAVVVGTISRVVGATVALRVVCLWRRRRVVCGIAALAAWHVGRREITSSAREVAPPHSARAEGAGSAAGEAAVAVPWIEAAGHALLAIALLRRILLLLFALRDFLQAFRLTCLRRDDVLPSDGFLFAVEFNFQFDLFAALASHSDLVQAGGHPMAAGLSVAEEDIERLRKALKDKGLSYPKISEASGLEENRLIRMMEGKPEPVEAYRRVAAGLDKLKG